MPLHVAEHEDWDVAKPSDPLVCIARKKMLEKVKSKFKVKTFYSKETDEGIAKEMIIKKSMTPYKLQN